MAMGKIRLLTIKLDAHTEKYQNIFFIALKLISLKLDNFKLSSNYLHEF